MQLEKITLGNHFPEEMPAVIEMPMHHSMVKYEMDKTSGALFVDRFMATTMCYPCHYGFIPHTCAGDGDPMDALVISPYLIIAGAVIKVRPVGVLLMEDEAGLDEKIITVPTKKTAPSLAHIESIDHVDTLLKRQIIHFFSHYKDLEVEEGKWVKVKGFSDKRQATALLQKAVHHAK